jgi:hypothetical protein
MKIFSIVVLVTLYGVASKAQVFISDSVTYQYAGSADPDEIDRYLRSFGCINQVTENTLVIRDGDFIKIQTKLKGKGRYKMIDITLQGKTAMRTTKIDSVAVMGLQLMNGYAQGSIYYEELNYSDPIHSIESPYMSINWVVYDEDEDENFERLELKLINSKDIIQIYHCHLQ